MLSDIIRPSSISCSNVPGLTSSYYVNTNGNVSTVLTTLDTVTLPENAFAADGDFMEFEYFGGFGGAADTEVFLYFGTDALFSSGTIDPGAEDWVLRGKMVRTGAETQYTIATLSCTSLNPIVILNSTAITFGPAIALALKGNGTGANSVVCRAGFRQFYFQNR